MAKKKKSAQHELRAEIDSLKQQVEMLRILVLGFLMDKAGIPGKDCPGVIPPYTPPWKPYIGDPPGWWHGNGTICGDGSVPISSLSDAQSNQNK